MWYDDVNKAYKYHSSKTIEANAQSASSGEKTLLSDVYYKVWQAVKKTPPAHRAIIKEISCVELDCGEQYVMNQTLSVLLGGDSMGWIELYAKHKRGNKISTKKIIEKVGGHTSYYREPRNVHYKKYEKIDNLIADSLNDVINACKINKTLMKKSS